MNNVNFLRSKKRKRLTIAALILCGGFIIACILSKFGYDYIFQRVEVGSNAAYAEYTDLDPEKYSRSMVLFISGDHQLTGYINGSRTDKGIAQIPVMIIHGKEDRTLRPEVSGIISCQSEINNTDVLYVLRDTEHQNGHVDLVYALDESQETTGGLDKALFDDINRMFENAVTK